MEFENKVVLITGGGGGIGKAAARRFLEEGARGVVLGSRRQEVLEAAKEELDPSGQWIELFAGDASRRLRRRSSPRLPSASAGWMGS